MGRELDYHGQLKMILVSGNLGYSDYKAEPSPLDREIGDLYNRGNPLGEIKVKFTNSGHSYSINYYDDTVAGRIIERFKTITEEQCNEWATSKKDLTDLFDNN